MSEKLVFEDDFKKLIFEDLQPKLVFEDDFKKLEFDEADGIFDFTFNATFN